jgi:hypothetical protein
VAKTKSFGTPGRPATRLPASPAQHALDWQRQHKRDGGSVRKVTLYAAATRALKQLARPRKASALIDKLIIAEWIRLNPDKTVQDLLPPVKRRKPAAS